MPKVNRMLVNILPHYSLTSGRRNDPYFIAGFQFTCNHMMTSFNYNIKPDTNRIKISVLIWKRPSKLIQRRTGSKKTQMAFGMRPDTLKYVCINMRFLTFSKTLYRYKQNRLFSFLRSYQSDILEESILYTSKFPSVHQRPPC